jgi:hypothetical protein
MSWIGSSSSVPEANTIINELSIVKKIHSEVNKEALFFVDAIVDGCKGRWWAAAHRDALLLLDKEVSKFENIVFKQGFDGI